MTDNELKELERLAEAATPGPWRKCNDNNGKCPSRLEIHVWLSGLVRIDAALSVSGLAEKEVGE